MPAPAWKSSASASRSAAAARGSHGGGAAMAAWWSMHPGAGEYGRRSLSRAAGKLHKKCQSYVVACRSVEKGVLFVALRSGCSSHTPQPCLARP